MIIGMNKRNGIIAFLLNLAPAWFSAIAPIFLLAAVFGLVVAITSSFSPRVDKSYTFKVILLITIALGAIASAFIGVEFITA